MDRSAPTDGYSGHAPKRQYRRAVWNSFKEFTGTETYNAHALLMPSIEGEEIEVALSKGFREEHLHAVDRNPAIVAHIKRRFPRINTYGVDVVRAAVRIAAGPYRLAVANLDFCGPIDASASDITAFVRSGCLMPKSRIAVTGLRGREHGDGLTATTIRNCQKPKPVTFFFRRTGHSMSGTIGDGARFLSLLNAVTIETGYSVGLARVDKYKSNAGSQTMIWFVLELQSREWVDDKLGELRSLIDGDVLTKDEFTKRIRRIAGDLSFSGDIRDLVRKLAIAPAEFLKQATPTQP